MLNSAAANSAPAFVLQIVVYSVGVAGRNRLEQTYARDALYFGFGLPRCCTFLCVGGLRASPLGNRSEPVVVL
jgi:hypothetical protein